MQNKQVVSVELPNIDKEQKSLSHSLDDTQVIMKSNRVVEKALKQQVDSESAPINASETGAFG